MDDTEHEPPLEDFTVEITDLDRSTNRAEPKHWLRLTSRQRRLSLAATIVLFVLVLGLLLNSVSSVRDLVKQTFRQPTNTPNSSTLANSLFVYLRGNPTWGHFMLDGKALAHTPVIGRDQPLKLAPGQHTIIWQAEPFKPKTCTFTVADASTLKGPCFLDSSITTNFQPGAAAMTLAFFASLSDLPTEQRASLTQQLQELFANYGSTSQVQPGELYAVSEQVAHTNPALCRPFEGLALCYAQANQPLLATLSLQMDTLTSNTDPCVVAGQCDSYHQDCRALCEDPVVNYSQQAINGWSVQAVVDLLWSYRTLSGQVVASAQPDTAIRGAQTYQFVYINIDRSTQDGWQITPFPAYDATSSNPVCMQATGDTMSVLNASFDNNSNMYVAQSISNANQMALGCLTIAMQPENQVSSTPTPTPAEDAIPPASFLARFGVLLAVSASAHKVCPEMPVASAYERGVAQNLQTEFSPSA